MSQKTSETSKERYPGTGLAVRRPKKGRVAGLLLVLAGLLLLMTPFVGDMVGGWLSGQAIAAAQTPARQNDAATQALHQAAASHNAALAGTSPGVVDPFAVRGYETQNPLAGLDKDQPIGHISIPAIETVLPIYVGASENHLEKGAAIVDGTALPVGGIGTRSVIAAHRGHLRQRYFLYINKLLPGDRIYLYVLGQVLEYEVVDQEVINPSENEKIRPAPGKDMVTLLACTPIPAYDKRILVNAVRVETPPSSAAPGAASAAISMPTTVPASPVPRVDGAVRWFRYLSYGVILPGLLLFAWLLRKLYQIIKE